MASSRPAQSETVRVTLRGEIADGTVEYARTKVAHALRFAHEPVLSAHVVLTVAPDPAVARPARAEASVDVSGTQVRAHATAAEMHEAVDFLEAKLRQNLVQHNDRVRTRHRWIGLSSDHQWRHGDLPTQRQGHFPRPPEERQVLRRKTFALEPMTPDEAAFDMDLLGHDFYLFTDLSSGKDAVVHRNGDGRFAVVGETTPDTEPSARVQWAGAAPTLSEAEAIARLGLTGDPFLFFLDPETHRGRVLYLRYDGHYGLITAA